MMKALWRRFLELDFKLQLVLVFCLYGTLLNTVFLCRDFSQQGLLMRLHLCFLLLYAGQVVFILRKERMVFVLSLLQAVLAFLTNADFAFVPVVRMVGYAVFMFKGEFTIEEMDVYKYVFVSACLTLELLKTYWLFALLPAPKKKKPQPAEASVAEVSASDM